MCGISGIAALRPVNRNAVQAMTDILAHRGPDGAGIWLSDDSRLGFGHRRLAIIDISENGAQPMHDARGSLTITFNGEIYNYKEIRAELQKAGIVFRTESDTEVILEAYRAWGEACVSRFNGMFAFALHDYSTNTVFMARDRFGEKPLLFSAQPDVFAFASEYKALLKLDCVRPEIDPTRLLRFTLDPTHALDHDRQTLFDDIQELRPGETLRLSLNDLSWTTEAYWTPPELSMDHTATDEESAVEFRELLRDSIRLRLRSDVPVGSCLSGGLDSSAITCMASELSDSTFGYHVFTGRFPGTEADEGTWAQYVVDATDAEQHQAFPTGEGLVKSLTDFVWHNELPVDSASQFAQWSVFECAANENVTVLLDGQGSDEILAGYEQYFAAYLRTAPQSSNEIAQICQRYPDALTTQDNAWKDRIPVSLKRAASRLMQRGSSPLLGMRRDWAILLSDISSTPDTLSLHAALRKDATNGFLTTLLRYGDRNSMAHSREVRLPFCDHRIIEFVFKLPPERLMGHGQTKRLLRDAMTGILPEPIRTRWRKQGFLPPIASWLEGALGEDVETVFHSTEFAHDPLWDAAWWQTALKRFRHGEQALASSIWKPYFIFKWQQHFLERGNRMQKVSPYM